MRTVKRKLILLCMVCVMVISFIIIAGDGSEQFSANAKAIEAQPVVIEESGNNSTYGILTTLSLSVDGGDGQVKAIVRNDLTIFPAKVMVYVQLYCSDTYKESYTEMELAAQNYTSDLNMGKSITVSASTNGEQKYWKARAYYKIDKKDWKEKITNTWLCDADGLAVV